MTNILCCYRFGPNLINGFRLWFICGAGHINESGSDQECKESDLGPESSDIQGSSPLIIRGFQEFS